MLLFNFEFFVAVSLKPILRPDVDLELQLGRLGSVDVRGVDELGSRVLQHFSLIRYLTRFDLKYVQRAVVIFDCQVGLRFVAFDHFQLVVHIGHPAKPNRREVLPHLVYLLH